MGNVFGQSGRATYGEGMDSKSADAIKPVEGLSPELVISEGEGSNGGFRVTGLEMALDVRRACPWGFVSHAHADHFARHRRVVCSPPTADALRARYGVAEERLEVRGFGECWEEDGFRLSLHPAGHVLGSAMLHGVRMCDGVSFLYTGDCRIGESFTAEPIQVPRADVLAMETTFAKAVYAFPPRARVWGEVADFVKETHEGGGTPVLLAYGFGKAQEAVAALAAMREDLVFHLHKSAWNLMEVYRRWCPDVRWPEMREFDAERVATMPGSAVVVVPPGRAGLAVRRGVKEPRAAMLTGWGLHAQARFRYGCEAVFPISDHLDHAGAHELVKRSGAQVVYTLHGYAREFAAELRAKGIEAWTAEGFDQLELRLDP